MALQSGEALTPGYSRMQGRTQPGRALSVYVPLQLCSATVPGASRNDTALMGDYWAIEVKISGAGMHREGGSRQRTPQRLFIYPVFSAGEKQT